MAEDFQLPGLPTRLLHSEGLSGRVRGEVYLKLESELPTGSFKVRGAIYALRRAFDEGGANEVVAASTGNHGAAVAYAAQQIGMRASIFVPNDANLVKCAIIRSLGAMVTHAGHNIEDARVAAREHARTPGVVLLDDATNHDVPIGTGAIALEILQQLPAVDTVYVPVGDTALIRGVASVFKERRPDVSIIGIQAAGAPAYYESWRSGQAITTETADTIADGLATTRATEDNVRAILRLVDDMRLVSDAAMLRAVGILYLEDGVTAEPSSAATVAALLDQPNDPGRAIVLIITGSNIPPALLERALQSAS